MEHSTKERLDEQGVETLLPVLVQRQYGRKRASRVIKTLLVPSYLFMRVALSPDHWQLIHGTKGVVGLVGRYVTRRLGGQREHFVVPLPLPAADMNKLLSAVDGEGMIERPAETAAELKGKLLRVLAGPFTSFPGHCEECDVERQRVTVGVQIFGRTTSVELDLEDVELIRGR